MEGRLFFFFIIIATFATQFMVPHQPQQPVQLDCHFLLQNQNSLRNRPLQYAHFRITVPFRLSLISKSHPLQSKWQQFRRAYTVCHWKSLQAHIFGLGQQLV
ncbi:hypothetical protein TB1_031188 [Malus domestica]